MLLLADGRLHPTTPTGEFTIRRLRLNRLPLIAYRLVNRSRTEEQQLLARYRDRLRLIEQLKQQFINLLEEQRALLEQQRTWLRLLKDHEE
jgi:hypothetical protein